MDNSRFIKIESLDREIPKINPDLLKATANDLHKQLTNITSEHQFLINAMDNQRRLKEEREEENRANLKSTSENLEKVNEKLEVQIQQKDEDLQMQREMIHMLKQQLIGINRTLSDLFIIEENNQELQEEANELAREIYAGMIQKKKIDWKSIIIDKGSDVVFAAIPIILQLAEIL